MDYIVIELERNGVDIDKEVIKEQMNIIRKEYEPMYMEILNCINPEDLINIFHATDINTHGRVLSYLVLLYYERERGVDITEHLHLVALTMKVISKKDKKTFCQRIGSIACIYTAIFVRFLLLYYSISYCKFL